MRKSLQQKSRKEMELKMSTVFSEAIQSLPKELQRILIDDLVTAFESRFAILNRAQTSRLCQMEIVQHEDYQTA